MSMDRLPDIECIQAVFGPWSDAPGPEDWSEEVLVLERGHYAGYPITHVPSGYLCRLVDKDADEADEARAELTRHGLVLPSIQVSMHAFARAIECYREVWVATSEKNEGLYTWLNRMAHEALAHGEFQGDGQYRYQGITWAFQTGAAMKTLATLF